MTYVLPVLAFLSLAAWVWIELRDRQASPRLLVGAITVILVASAAYHLGRFAEFNRQRYYPLALIEISNQLADGRDAEVQAAISQVFGAEQGAYDVESIELMRALSSNAGSRASER